MTAQDSVKAREDAKKPRPEVAPVRAPKARKVDRIPEPEPERWYSAPEPPEDDQ